MTLPPFSFLFVRHGQTVANTYDLCSGLHCPSPLTALGREQARAAGTFVKKISAPLPDLVFHSATVRATQTAELLSVPAERMISLPALGERHYGAWEGLPFESVKEEIDAGRIGEGGESQEEFYTRIQSALDTIRAQAGKKIVVVAHGLVWQVIHALHGQKGPWISNGDVFNVRMSKENGFFSSRLHTFTANEGR